jgi:hypothetical protein
MKHRVSIGTCSGPAEAAFVRSVFDAHDLPVVINGEMHASVMGGLGGFVRLEIFVDKDDADEATALLRDIRDGEHAVDGDEIPSDPDAPDGDERADAEGVWDARGEHRAPDPPPADDTEASAPFDTRRRRTGAVLLVSAMIGFGAAHMATGAWGRGAVLAALNLVGIAYAVQGHPVGGWLMFGTRVGDLLGALWRVWWPSRPAHESSSMSVPPRSAA